jgi:hypothetical protein
MNTGERTVPYPDIHVALPRRISILPTANLNFVRYTILVEIGQTSFPAPLEPSVVCREESDLTSCSSGAFCGLQRRVRPRFLIVWSPLWSTAESQTSIPAPLEPSVVCRGESDSFLLLWSPLWSTAESQTSLRASLEPSVVYRGESDSFLLLWSPLWSTAESQAPLESPVVESGESDLVSCTSGTPCG